MAHHSKIFIWVIDFESSDSENKGIQAQFATKY